MEYKEISNIEQGITNDEGDSVMAYSFILGEPRQLYDLEERLLAFAVLVCQLAEQLPQSRVGNHVAGQLIRSGTAPASNYGEAQSAESRRDFIHKMKICLKELRETNVWLRFIKRMGLNHSAEISTTIQESNELIAIFVKSISTAQTNLKTKR
jgi:four helix bundle protein